MMDHIRQLAGATVHGTHSAIRKNSEYLETARG